MKRVVVVGGGISGLAAAYSLRRRLPEVTVTLVEADGRVGGTMATDVVDGFLFERGPNGFLESGNGARTLALAHELGLDDELVEAAGAAVHRYILRRGTLVAVPTSPGAFLRSPILSVRGKLRVLSEFFRAPRRDEGDESIGSFARRRIGSEATTTLIAPLVTGIYAGDVDRISVQAAFPRLAALEANHGGLFRGQRALRRARRAAGQSTEGGAGPAGGGGRLRSFRRGLSTLTGALAERIGEGLRLEARAATLAREGDGFGIGLSSGERVIADVLVMAAPAPSAAALLRPLSSELGSALDAVPYAPVGVVCLGYAPGAVGRPLDGYGFLVPRTEGLRSLGMIWTSALFPDHAPAGAASLRAMVGGALDPGVLDLSDDDLVALVLRELGGLVGARGAPLARSVIRYPRGIPQYNVGHLDRVAAIESAAALVPGLFLTGNAYHGVALNDCVASGERTAEAVAAHVGAPAAS